ncbi:MAG: RNase H family protein [Desulfatiglandales bacterium]
MARHDRRNGWRTSQKKEVKNRDLWERLLSLCGRHLVEWRWLKGHGGDPLNERCDRLAKGAIKDCTG